ADRGEGVVALHDVQDLPHRDTTGTRRRHGIDRVAAVTDLNRRAPLGPVAAQVVFRDQATAALHLGDDQVRDLAAIEYVGAGVTDQLQRAGEVGLLPEAARSGRVSAGEKLRARRRELRQAI